MSLVRIKSYHPLTEFAPSWNIPLWLTNWTDLNHVDSIHKWIVDNEETILKDYAYTNSGGTGLDDNHITTRFGKYNLLNQDLDSFKELLTFLRYSYLEYVQKQQLELKDLQIVCWANVLRKDEGMDSHAHGAQPDSYLSGNMHFDDYHTRTVYHSTFDPESKIALPNNSSLDDLFHKSEPSFPSYAITPLLQNKLSVPPPITISKIPSPFKSEALGEDKVAVESVNACQFCENPTKLKTEKNNTKICFIARKYYNCKFTKNQRKNFEIF